MKCPDCFGRATTIESRHAGLSKRRRHQCCNSECQLRFTTYELIVGPGAPTPVKDYLKYLASRKTGLPRKGRPQG